MADSVTLEVKGLKELVAMLEALPERGALVAGKRGSMAAAARMRTFLRRAAPVKSGFLKAAIRTGGFKDKKKAAAYVGIRKAVNPKDGKSGAPNYYKTLEFGRKPYVSKGNGRRRAGTHYKGSPQMARFAFWKRTVDGHRAEVFAYMVERTSAALMRETGRMAVRLNAPIKYRRGK